MILSKNAVGNLINRYKAVLGKCRLLNTFGSLALAAALALGSAGLAVAAQYDSADDWTGEVSIDGDVTVNTFFTEDPEGQNITATSITLGEGASLTLKGGARLINGIPGSDGDAPERLAFVMTGGELALGGTGDTYAGNGINASINAKSVDISGGTVDITGKTAPSNWYQAAQLGGYRGLTVSGGTIYMNSYSQMFGGGAVGAQFTGGTINMLGNTTASILDDSAAHIMFGGSGANLIAGTAVINVGTDSAAGYGVITTGSKVNMTGGSINVRKGELLLQADTNDNDGDTSLVYTGDETGAFNQTGGEVAISGDGTMTLNKKMTYTLSGGSLSNAGILNVDGSGGDSGLNLEKTAAFNNSGTINVTQGMIHMDGSMGTDQLLASGTGQVNLKNGGQLLFTYDNGSVVDLTDKLANIATTGKISLTSGSGITGIAGITLGDASFDYSGVTLNTNSLQAGEDGAFTVQSGTINAGEFSLLGSDPSGTALTVAVGGSLTLGKTVSGHGPEILPTGGRIADTLTNTGNTTIEAGDNWSAGAVTNSGGTFKVAGGKLTVGDLSVSSGAVIVGGASGSAGLHIENSIKSNTEGNRETTGINVLQNGVLSGAAEKFVTYPDEDTAERATDLAKMYVANGGTLRLDGLSEITLAQARDTKSKVLADGSAGLISYGDAKVIVQEADKVGGNIKSDAIEGTNLMVADENVAYDAAGTDGVIVKGDFGADALAITNNGGTNPVTATIKNNTTLLGNGGQLITASGEVGTNVTIEAGKNLNLGSTGATSNGGTLNGNVELQGADSALNVAAADFTVGDITAAAHGNGNVNVSAGGGLTAGAIGTFSSAVNSVSANNGTLKATGDIYADTVTATNGSISAKGDIALTGAASVTNGSLSADNITAASVSAIDAAVTAKTLTASADVTVVNGALTATGTDANASSVTGRLTLTGSQANLGDMTVTDATKVTGGSLVANSLTIKANSSFTDGAQVTVDQLANIGGVTITVGNASDAVGGTTLTVGSLDLAGGNLVIDPAWGLASSNVAVGSFADSATGTDYSINGNVGVGMNSMAAIGTTNTGWLAGQVADVTNGAGLTQTGVTAALGLKEAQVLGTGFGIEVDGSKTSGTLAPSANTATFADNSLLVVTAAAAKNADGALSATTATSAIIGDSAKLRITDAKVGQKYTVLGDNIAANKGGGGITVATGWTGSNFSTDSRMIKGSFDAASGVLTASLNSSANIYPKLDGELVAVLDNAYTADEVGPAHVNSDVKGVRFLSRATNDNFIGANSDLAAKTIESAARIAVAGAVPQMAMAANNAAGAAITQRTSIAQPDGNGMQSVSLNKADGVNKKGAALWIMPLYQGQNAWGMEAGNFDLKWHGGLGGVALGGDYTFDNALRAGIAFNIGGGYAEGEGDLAKTTNSFNFWGLGAYAGWAVENFGITADVNYTSTYNKVKQELPGAMQMRDLKSDITAYALSSGLRAEYKFNTQYVDIIPHLGVRYMYVNTDSYDVKSNGTVMHGDETSQNIWTFPIGVTFSKQVETGNGWYVKPSLDLGVLPATGDIDAKSKIRFTGTGTKAELDTRTMDYMSYTGGLGLDFGNNNLSFGLNYNIQASEHTTSHGVFGTARYEF